MRVGKTFRLYLLPALILLLLTANIACAGNLPPDPGEAGKATLAGIDLPMMLPVTAATLTAY